MPINELLLTEFDEEIKKTRTMTGTSSRKQQRFRAPPQIHAAGTSSRPTWRSWPALEPLFLRLPRLDWGRPRCRPCPLTPQHSWSRPSMKVRPKLAPRLRTRRGRCLDSTVEAKFRRQAHLQRDSFSSLPANVSQSPRASSRPTGSLSPPERNTGASDLRPLGRRQDGILAGLDHRRGLRFPSATDRRK